MRNTLDAMFASIHWGELFYPDTPLLVAPLYLRSWTARMVHDLRRRSPAHAV